MIAEGMHVPHTDFKGKKTQRSAKDGTKIARNPIPVFKKLVKPMRG